MNGIARRRRQAECEGVEIELNGGRLVCDPSGALYAPELDLLVVSDLHLEKGAAFARRGLMLPPYDTLATLGLLQAVIERYEPARVVSLGDSFHDREGAALMPGPMRETLAALVEGRDWIWIAGNHDPDPPAGLGGRALQEARLGPFLFRHEPMPGGEMGEISGHLHPVAKVTGNGRSVRGACFATDGRRLVMPSFGVTTGGLNVLDRAFDGLFEASTAQALVIGLTKIYPIPFRLLAAR